MKIRQLHPWNVSPEEAVALQKKLRQNLCLQNSFTSVRTVAGCDMALDPVRNEGYAGVLVYCWPELELIEQQSAVLPLAFPYMPGLLSFREIPVLTAAIEKLNQEPDLFFFDGQGVAHPRGMGIAAHMGLLLEKPSIGCAKSLLYGNYKEPGLHQGDVESLYSKSGEQIGSVLRTKPRCNPIFVSPGHRIDLKTSLDFVVRCLDGYRLPKPTRQADAFVGTLRREATKNEPELF